MRVILKRDRPSHESSRGTDCQRVARMHGGNTYVIRGSSRDKRFTGSWSWIELEESVFQGIVNFENSSLITASVAVVGCREDRNDITLL